jgi:N-sulfoglucosamine sulfohydrolase
MKGSKMDGNQFKGRVACANWVCLALSVAVAMQCVNVAIAAEQASPRPNILWITCEDTSPDLGCYGDAQARTPNLDRLAGQGARFTNAFSVAGVCAPSRSGLITCMYPTTIGTQHMRCKGVPPSYVKCFPEYLRAAGYYCTNNFKTDYQFDPPITAWDEVSQRAHWRGRAKDQPFFAVFNFITTHESQIRATAEQFAKNTKGLRPEDRHDPAKAVLPPYYPDTPVVRNDWARYYDLVTAMDLQVAAVLKQLEEDGLAENTIVFFYGDHGRGLPRGKRWIYDSGIKVPLIIRWPGKIEPGSVNDQLVSFIDFGPTVLSLAGVQVPKTVQGRPFLGSQATTPREYIFAARDRMDERYDIIRCVRDKRFKYIRNYEPEKPYAQHISYMDEMPTMQEWRRLNATGELKGPQTLFFQPTKPVEELYDITKDPHEINNLAGSSEHEETLRRLRKVNDEWRAETQDLGLIPEAEWNERIRPGGKWSVTAKPDVKYRPGKLEDQVNITLTCKTEGSSIAYAVDLPAKSSGTIDSSKPLRWKLYTQPFELKEGQAFLVQACRIGFKDSSVLEATADKDD